MTAVQAIRWQNGMVMVFDAAGEQVTDLQGRYDEVRDRVLAEPIPPTGFYHGTWAEELHSVRKDDW